MNYLEQIKFDDLIGTKFEIELGSMTTCKIWDKESFIKEIKNVIQHNLFDSEFYYNWTNNKEEYIYIFNRDTSNPFLNNINKTINEMFVLNNGTYTNKKLVFNLNNYSGNWVDNWFKTNESISNSLKQEYYDYRYKYASVNLNK